MKNKYKQLFTNTLIFAIGSIGSKFITFLLIPLYTYALSAEEYGLSELVVTGINLLIPFLSLSIQDALLRYGLDKKYDRDSVFTNCIFILLIGTIVSILIMPLISLYKPISNYSLYFVLLLIFNMIRNVFSIQTKVLEKNKIFATDAIIYSLSSALFSYVLMILLNYKVDGYFISLILSNIISIIYLTFKCDIFKTINKSKFDLSLLKIMLSFSIPLILNAVSWWIVNSSDRIMLNIIVDAAAVGIYSVSAKIPSIITNITSIFNQAWMISSIKEYDDNRDSKFYLQTFEGYHFILIVLSALFIIFIKIFMMIYVSRSFYESWKYIPLLMMGSIFYSYANFFGAVYMSAKKNMNIMLTTLLAAIVNIILNFILIPLSGIMGAVIATFISYGIVGIYRLIGVKSIISFNLNYKKVFLELALVFAESITIMIGGLYYILSLLILFILLFDFRTEIYNLVIKLFYRKKFK